MTHVVHAKRISLEALFLSLCHFPKSRYLYGAGVVTAINQKTLNQMRAMGAAKGTLRTGIITGKANTAQGVLG